MICLCITRRQKFHDKQLDTSNMQVVAQNIKENFHYFAQRREPNPDSAQEKRRKGKRKQNLCLLACGGDWRGRITREGMREALF